MREPPLSTCERNFLLQSFLENFRVDGREVDQYRDLNVRLGLEPGSCLAQLGDTKVFTQVSCELIEPKETRPNEGTLFVGVEMSAMAAPQYEFGRSNDTGIELCRLLERIIKESGCVDTESLCVKAGELAWQIRLDVHVLDDDGALVDCASVAAVCALAHTKRPDVTVTADNVTVHTFEERDPIPLNLYHYPICVTFGFSENGACIIVDPTDKERQVLDGSIVVGANKRKEICALHCTGALMTDRQQIQRVSSRAIQRAAFVSDIIQSALIKQREETAKKTLTGFADQIAEGLQTPSKTKFAYFDRASTSAAVSVPPKPEPMVVDSNVTDISAKGRVARVGGTAGTSSDLLRIKDEEMVLSSDDEGEIVEELRQTTVGETRDRKSKAITERETTAPVPTEKKRRTKKTKDSGLNELLGEIENDVLVLDSNDLGFKQEAVTQPVPNQDQPTVDLTLAVKSRNKKKKAK